MHSLRFCLALSLSLTACGGVAIDSDPAADPPPTPTPPTPTSPLPPAPPEYDSLICPSAPVADGHDVALWYQTYDSAVFVHHDGTSSVIWSQPDTAPSLQVEVASAKTRLFVATHTSVDEPSSLRMFDRRGTLLAEQTFASGFVSSLFASDDGRVVFTLGKGEIQEGYSWDGSQLSSLGPWLPVGPTAHGFTPARSGWGSDASHVFVSDTGSVVPIYTGKASVFPVGERLVFVDPITRSLRINTPNGTQALSLGDFAQEDPQAPVIAQVRDGRYVLLRHDVWAKGDVLVIDVESAHIDFHPDTSPKPDDLSFYCNSGWPGYLTSNGSLLRSRIAGGKLQIWSTTPNSETAIGTPMTGIAMLGLVERGGTIGIVGSDGSDTYCGTPSEIWQDPSPPGTLDGDSLQLVRGSAAPKLGKFPGSFNEPSIHPSGACVLSSSFQSPDWQTQVEDLDTGALFDLPATSGLVRWID